MAVFSGNGSATAPSFTFSSDTNLGIFRGGTDIISFTTDGTERARFDAAGALEIGGTLGSDPNIDLDGSNGNIISQGGIDGAVLYATDGLGGKTEMIVARDGGTTGFIVQGSGGSNGLGSVLIGGTLPTDPNISLNADGDGQFDGTVVSGVIDNTTLYSYLDNGRIQINRTNTELAFSIAQDGTSNATIDADGSAYFGDQVDIGGTSASPNISLFESGSAAFGNGNIGNQTVNGVYINDSGYVAATESTGNNVWIGYLNGTATATSTISADGKISSTGGDDLTINSQTFTRNLSFQSDGTGGALSTFYDGSSTRKVCLSTGNNASELVLSTRTGGVNNEAITIAANGQLTGIETIKSDQTNDSGYFFLGESAGNTRFEVQSDGTLSLRDTSGTAIVTLNGNDGTGDFRFDNSTTYNSSNFADTTLKLRNLDTTTNAYSGIKWILGATQTGVAGINAVRTGSQQSALSFVTSRSANSTGQEAMRIDHNTNVKIPIGNVLCGDNNAGSAGTDEPAAVIGSGTGTAAGRFISFVASDTTSSNTAFAVQRTTAAGGGNVFLVTAAGALSKASGSFKIDHPLPAKSETHHLVHSFIEGPQADNIYRGQVELVDGEATVNLDTAARMTEGTFVLLNTNISCFTSNETDWTAVRGSVSGNVLTIEAQDNTSTATVSWMVVGERHDAHMIDTDWTDDNGRVITEPEKTVEEETYGE